MAESLQVAVVVLVALFIGVLIPVLVSLRSAMKNMTGLAADLQIRLGKVLDQTSGVLTHADRIGLELSHGSRSVRNSFEALDALTQSVNQMQKSMRVALAIGASIGPALAAAVQSLRRDREAEEQASAEMEGHAQRAVAGNPEVVYTAGEPGEGRKAHAPVVKEGRKEGE